MATCPHGFSFGGLENPCPACIASVRFTSHAGTAPPAPPDPRDEQIRALKEEAATATSLYWQVHDLRAALSDLVAASPECDHHEVGMPKCRQPATRAWQRGMERFCDEHGAALHVPEYPRAVPLRRAVALLRGASPAPPEKEE